MLAHIFWTIFGPAIFFFFWDFNTHMLDYLIPSYRSLRHFIFFKTFFFCLCFSLDHFCWLVFIPIEPVFYCVHSVVNPVHWDVVWLLVCVWVCVCVCVCLVVFLTSKISIIYVHKSIHTSPEISYLLFHFNLFLWILYHIYHSDFKCIFC